MLFASPLFLFAFLPSVILCYYAQHWLAGRRLKNAVLLFFSYLFYLFGAAEFLLLLIASTAADYLFGLLIQEHRKSARLWVLCSLALNLGLLIYFKYADFFVFQFNQAASTFGLPMMSWPSVALPIGISFFTFQKISYIIDVYREDAQAAGNIVDFALYVAMFPQLIAGPIVRFKDIQSQLKARRESSERFCSGVLRFCWGLGKKVLLADACGQVADAAFGLTPAMLDTKTAWLGALAYTLQIYFDFSAYSDMAIGLASLFGFELRENFNRPYAAVSITDFWRRWHISLGSWFKDYLYLPLGGNRQGAARTYINLLVVFLLCGLWHGASWTFVAWGLYHGCFLVLERISSLRYLPDRRWRLLRRPLTLVIVIFGWVLFRSPSLPAALGFWHVMVMPLNLPMTFELYEVLHYRNLTFMMVAFIGLLGSTRLPTAARWIETPGTFRTVLGWVILGLVLPYCTAFLMDGVSHPFIYFRF
jgi:alginate O-acetyltransferase complex protein AlgI